MEQSTLHIVNVKTGEQLLWCDVPVTPEQHRTAEDNNSNVVKSSNSKSKFCEEVTISPELEQKYDHVFTFLDVASRHCYELFGKHMRQQQEQQQQQKAMNLQEHLSQGNKTSSLSKNKKFESSTLTSHQLASSSPFASHQLRSVCTTVESSPCANSSAWSECDQTENSRVEGDDDIISEQAVNAQTTYTNEDRTNSIMHNNSHIMEKSNIYDEDVMNTLTEFDIYGDENAASNDNDNNDRNDADNDNINDELSEDNASSASSSSTSSSFETARKRDKTEQEDEYIKENE